MLSVSGLLDETMFGPGTLDEGMKRRSIYFFVKRSQIIPMMALFDAPNALGSMGTRSSTTIAPQALAMMNNTHVRDYAKAFANRLLSDAQKSPEAAVRKAYLIALARAGRARTFRQHAIHFRAGRDVQAKCGCASPSPDRVHPGPHEP